MKTASIVILFSLVVWLCPPQGHAETATVAIDHFPPWKIFENGKAGGIDVELTEALFQEVGVVPEFTSCPWARCLDMLEIGQIGFTSGILKRPERQEYLTYIDPPYKTSSSKVFYRLRTSKDIETIDDLNGLAIGIQRGSKFFPAFDDNDNLKKVTVANDKFNFLKLAQGRIQTVLTTESQGDYLIAMLGLQNKVVKSTYRHDTVNQVYFAISKHSPLHRLVPQFNEAARRLRDNGTFDRIIRDYFKSLKKESNQ